jgi:hypothetical protein
MGKKRGSREHMDRAKKPRPRGINEINAALGRTVPEPKLRFGEPVERAVSSRFSGQVASASREAGEVLVAEEVAPVVTAEAPDASAESADAAGASPEADNQAITENPRPEG